MDIINALRSYIESVLTNVHDMKVLLFDEDTSHIASLVYTQTELLKHDVVLIEPLNKCVNKPADEALSILNCVCILRPTSQNIHDLRNELNSPHFNTYYIFFTNVVQKEWLQILAQADHCCKVFVVHEIFIDVLALNKRLFSLNIPSCLNTLAGQPIQQLQASRDSSNPASLITQRIVDGLFSILCAFKLKTAIRYEATSPLCKAIGERLSSQIDDNNDLFQSTSAASLILLIDRRTDPITPILHNWSYQSLLHEFFGIQNNIVKVPNHSAVVLDERTDDFFGKNLNSDLGRLGAAHTELLKSVQEHQINSADIRDVEALKSFIRTYRIYQDEKSRLQRHTELLSAITSEVNRSTITGDMKAFAIIEQDIVTENSQSKQFEQVMSIIRDSRVTDQDALRVALLFAIKYENSKDYQTNLTDIKGALYARHNGDMMIEILDRYVQFAGNSYRRPEPLFGNQSIFSKARNFIGFNDNGKTQFTRYTSNFETLLQKIEKKQLDITNYPSIRELPGTLEPKKIIIFFIGGATYEEAKLAYDKANVGNEGTNNNNNNNNYENNSPGLDVIVGGTTIHNMNSFIYKEVMNKGNSGQ